MSSLLDAVGAGVSLAAGAAGSGVAVGAAVLGCDGAPSQPASANTAEAASTAVDRLRIISPLAVDPSGTNEPRRGGFSKRLVLLRRQEPRISATRLEILDAGSSPA
jgi:hypothetical protein